MMMMRDKRMVIMVILMVVPRSHTQYCPQIRALKSGIWNDWMRSEPRGIEEVCRKRLEHT